MESTDLIHSLANTRFLKQAWFKLNKRNSETLDLRGESFITFENNLDRNISQLSEELLGGKFEFTNVKAVPIKKEGNAIPRKIYVRNIRDRLVLKAITLLIEQPLDKKYGINNEASFAYLKKIGTEDAVRMMVKHFKDGYKVVLQGDIKDFFDTIPRSKLLEDYIYPSLKDESINLLIASGIEFELGNLKELENTHGWEMDLVEFFIDTRIGVPQGSALSPLLSNVYLSSFDNSLLKEGYKLIRYADDFLVMTKTVNEAEIAWNRCKQIIENQLELSLHPLGQKSKIYTNVGGNEEIVFLSVRFDGIRLLPEKAKFDSLNEKIRTASIEKSESVLQMLTKVRNILYGWLASFGYTNLDPSFEKIDDRVSYEVQRGLLKFGWDLKTSRLAETRSNINKSKKQCLSETQRSNSGIKTCSEFYRDSKRSVVCEI